jgi:hypothetical protein
MSSHLPFKNNFYDTNHTGDTSIRGLLYGAVVVGAVLTVVLPQHHLAGAMF